MRLRLLTLDQNNFEQMDGMASLTDIFLALLTFPMVLNYHHPLVSLKITYSRYPTRPYHQFRDT